MHGRDENVDASNKGLVGFKQRAPNDVCGGACGFTNVSPQDPSASPEGAYLNPQLGHGTPNEALKYTLQFDGGPCRDGWRVMSRHFDDLAEVREGSGEPVRIPEKTLNSRYGSHSPPGSSSIEGRRDGTLWPRALLYAFL